MPIAETAHDFLDALDRHDLDTLETFLSGDFQLDGNVSRNFNKMDVLALLNAYFTAFSDFSFNFSEANQLDDVLHVKYAISGTHDGVLDLNPLGMAITVGPTGKTIALPESSSEITFNETGQVTRQVLNQAAGAAMAGLLEQLGIEAPPVEKG
jgi:hypothetical protein